MTIDAAGIKRVIDRYHDGLVRHRETLNRLNVYPVPDGDTGTNMALTMTAVVEACNGAQTMAEVADAISHGSLMGARGNSGVILSQILRGLSDGFRSRGTVDCPTFADALNAASDAAYESVVRPVEGTILTVVREAATGAREATPRAAGDLAALLERTYERALRALETTPELLPVLKQAGVVDAGGAGLLLLFGAFTEELTGLSWDLPDDIRVAAEARRDVGADAAPGVADLRYEVMFFLESDDSAVADFRTAWAEIGDSIVVVGGDGVYNCHIHTDDIGSSIEAGIAAGRPFDIRVTDLLEQSGDAEHHGYEPLPAFAGAPLAVVAVAAGAGVIEMFRGLGAQAVVSGGQSMNPSTEELLEAVERVNAASVVVLPNNKNIVPVAHQLDSLTGAHVEVVPTRSIPEGIASMLAYMPEGDPVAVADAMRDAAAGITSGELTRAVRDAEIDTGSVHAGDWLVIVNGAIVASAADEAEALLSLVAHGASPGSELLTLILGDTHDPEAAEAAQSELARAHPQLEVETIEGGQPVYPYLVSIE